MRIVESKRMDWMYMISILGDNYLTEQIHEFVLIQHSKLK
jgi:hypothetical protein